MALSDLLPVINARVAPVLRQSDRTLFEFLDHILRRVLIPAVNSFFTLTLRNLANLTLKGASLTEKVSNSEYRAGKSSPADGRQATLAFFKTVLSNIHRTVLQTGHEDCAEGSRQDVAGMQQRFTMLLDFDLMRQSVIFEIIRNLVCLLIEHSLTVPNVRPTRDERMLILVLKETLWCTCSLVHLVLNFCVGELLQSIAPNGHCDPSVWSYYKYRSGMLEVATIKHFTWLLSATPNAPAQPDLGLKSNNDTADAARRPIDIEGGKFLKFSMR